MPVSHLDLRDLFFKPYFEGTEMSYGLCYGVTAKYLDAFFLGKREQFFKRFELLDSYKDKTEQLPKDIQQIRQKIIDAKARGARYELTDSENALLELPAFFEIVFLNHSPEKFDRIFKGIVTKDYLETHPITKPGTETKTPTKFLHHFLAAKKNELVSYFETLKEKMANVPGRNAFLLHTYSHVTALNYNPRTDRFEFFEINRLGFREEKPSFQSLTSQELVETLYFHFGLKAEDPMIIHLVGLGDERLTEKPDPFFKTVLPQVAMGADRKELFNRCLHLPGRETSKACLLNFAVREGSEALLEEALDENISMNQIVENGGMTPLMKVCQKGRTHLIKRLVESGAHLNAQSDDGFTALCCAVYSGKLASVKALLEHDTGSINIQRRNGITPLMVAVKNGHFKIVKYLLKKGASITLLDQEGNSALFYAISNGHSKILKLLINEGISFTKPIDKKGTTPLMLAIEKGHIRCVEVLITENPSLINELNSLGETPLRLAITQGNLPLVKLLVSKGADIHQENKNGYPPLYLAAGRGLNEICRYLITQGAEVNIAEGEKGVPPLLTAAINNHLSTCQLLLENGADINGCRLDDGTSALFWAVLKGREEVVDLLLQYQPELNRLDKKNGITPLHMAVSKGFNKIAEKLLNAGAQVLKAKEESYNKSLIAYAIKKGDLLLLDNIIKAGISLSFPLDNKGNNALHLAIKEGHDDIVSRLLDDDPSLINQENLEGETPLRLAIIKGDIPLVKKLVEMGADIHHESADGYTPIYCAAYQGLDEIVEYLIARGAKVNVKGGAKGLQPLLIAANHNHPSTCELLLKHGADINAQKKDDGTSALFRAVLNGHEEIVDLLLRYQPELNQPDKKNGITPLHMAAQKGFDSIAQKLLHAGAKDIPNRQNECSATIAKRYGHDALSKKLATHFKTQKVSSMTPFFDKQPQNKRPLQDKAAPSAEPRIKHTK